MISRGKPVVVASLLALSLAACAESGGRAGGETHWIRCESSAECEVLDQCVCGLCAPPCESDSACGDLGLPAICWPTPTTSETVSCRPAASEAARVCLPDCSSGDLDCRIVADDVTCQDGVCVVEAPVIDLDMGPSDGPDSDGAGDVGGADLGPTVRLALLIQSTSLPFYAPQDWDLWQRLPHIQSVDLALRDVVPELEPLTDVRVAIELSDGTRLGETTSNTKGLVVFEVPAGSWPETDTVSATAHGRPYIMHTLAGIARPTSAEPVALTLSRLRELPPGDTVRIEVELENCAQSDFVYVASTAPYGGSFHGHERFWALETPAAVPFDLVALEWARTSVRSSRDYELSYSWSRLSSDGFQENTVLAIDCDADADAVAPTTFSGSFQLPERADSPLYWSLGHPWLQAFSGDTYRVAPVGFETRFSPNGVTLGYTGELVASSQHSGSWYVYLVEADAELTTGPVWRGPLSVAYGRGVPDGPQPPLLDVPAWIDAPQTGYHQLDEPLSWELFNDDVDAYVWFSTGDDVVWQVELPQGASGASLPAPPSNVDLVELLGPEPTATIALQRWIDSGDGVFLLMSWGAELEVLSPY